MHGEFSNAIAGDGFDDGRHRADMDGMDTTARNDPLQTPSEIVRFWRDAGPDRWFAKDDAFDARFRAHCLRLHEAAARGALGSWQDTAEGALALVLLLDQFPRNCFRGTARMFATDAQARAVATAAIAAGHDQAVAPELRVFFYLPYEHSEDLADQERAVTLMAPLDEKSRQYAAIHHDIIRRFGRFPHRNAVLGRATTAEEQRFLDEGGFAG
jgi:uncharacterized protein (DUF924 family)